MGSSLSWVIIGSIAGSRGPDNFEPSRQPLLPPAKEGPKRLSLAPRNIYNNQQDIEPSYITNADHHFKFGQNPRYGLPMTQQHLPPAVPVQSPISQLATNMLHKTVLQPSPGSAIFSQGIHPGRFKQLQPPKQQFTPPFNLSKMKNFLFRSFF
jgi:hypothetical protein